MPKTIEDIKDFKSLAIKILNYFIKKNPKQLTLIIFMTFYLVLMMLLSDFMIFKTLGFSTQSILNFVSYDYEVKDSLRSIVLVFILLSTLAVIMFIINYFAKDTILNIDFEKINKVKKSNEYKFKKNLLKKFIKINLILMVYICFIFILIGIFAYLKLLPYISLYLILTFISNLYLLSYLYKYLIIIDNNFSKLDNEAIKSIINKNFYLLFLSILVITPSILSFIIGIVGAFTFKILTLSFIVFLSTIILSLSVVILLYDNRINNLINSKFKNTLSKEVRINSSKNKIIGILILIFTMYFYINYNINTFLKNIANHKKETSIVIASFNLVLNTGLIDKTKYNIKIKTNKIVNLNNKLSYKDGYIEIPRNSKNVISSNLQITKNRYLYFIRNKNSMIIDVFLTKRLEKNGIDEDILIEKVSKNL